VIAANLISGVLVQLAPLFPSCMKQGGIAFLSGILSGQEEEVIEAMKDEGLEIIEKYPDGKWISLVVKRCCTVHVHGSVKQRTYSSNSE
jgi:ribosomal protein L11 methyltransferase